MTPSPQAIIASSQTPRDIQDVRFDEVFNIITGNAFEDANELQQALFPRLITKDTGIMLATGPCAGRLEAVVVPSLAGMRVDAAAHRLFIVGPDGRPLDDYAYRLSKYVSALVTADGVERTIWFEEPARPPIAWTFMPDGAILNGAADHPFSENVDIVTMPFSHFRSTFFGSGGVHGMPETIGYDQEASELAAPRGLIYFDDAFANNQEDRTSFVQLVEFLFAQDLDIVVGSSCLPISMRDDLSALELVDIKSAQLQPERLIEFTSDGGARIQTITGLVKRHYDVSARIIVAFNLPTDMQIDAAYQALKADLAPEAFCYRSNVSRAERRIIYAKLRELESQGLGYVVVMDAPALEAADLDASVLITEECDPVSFVRRAGRCNRRGTNPDSIFSVVGEQTVVSANPIGVDNRRQAALSSELRNLKGAVEYEPIIWEGFVD